MGNSQNISTKFTQITVRTNEASEWRMQTQNGKFEEEKRESKPANDHKALRIPVQTRCSQRNNPGMQALPHNL